MSNRFFDFLASPFRFRARTKARAEEVNARLDEVSHGFELAEAEIDAHGLAIAARAPLAAPALTGNATLDGKALATQEHVASVAMQTAIPVPAGSAYKSALVDPAGAAAGWSWPRWESVTASATAKAGQRLRVLMAAADQVVSMPAAPEDDAPLTVKAMDGLGALPFLLQPAAGHAFEGLAVGEPLLMDLPGLCLEFAFKNNVWSIV